MTAHFMPHLMPNQIIISHISATITYSVALLVTLKQRTYTRNPWAVTLSCQVASTARWSI